MTIKGLLTSGSENRGITEKIADFTLAPARGLWRGKKISIMEHGAGYEIKNDSDKNYSSVKHRIAHMRRPSIGTQILFVAASAGYVAASIAVLPLVAVGLGLKGIALLTDKKARAYHKFVEKAIACNNLENDKITYTDLKKRAAWVEDNLKADPAIPKSKLKANKYEKRRIQNHLDFYERKIPLVKKERDKAYKKYAS